MKVFYRMALLTGSTANTAFLYADKITREAGIDQVFRRKHDILELWLGTGDPAVEQKGYAVRDVERKVAMAESAKGLSCRNGDIIPAPLIAASKSAS